MGIRLRHVAAVAVGLVVLAWSGNILPLEGGTPQGGARAQVAGSPEDGLTRGQRADAARYQAQADALSVARLLTRLPALGPGPARGASHPCSGPSPR